jgi:hypothetical protein
VRPAQYRAQTTYNHIARIVAAMTLVVALLSGSAPPGSLAFAAPVSECSMSCCIGKPRHAADDCASVSCHVKLPGHGASNDSHDGAHEDQHATAPPLQTVDDNTHQGHGSHAPQQASHDSHSGHVKTHHAKTHPASHASEETEPDAAPQSKVGQPDSRRRSVAAHASVANPCPSDCGMAAGGLGNNVRPRDAATLAQVRRPRLPARVAALEHFSTLPRTSSDRRRFAPPRAPPVAL